MSGISNVSNVLVFYSATETAGIRIERPPFFPATCMDNCWHWNLAVSKIRRKSEAEGESAWRNWNVKRYNFSPCKK